MNFLPFLLCCDCWQTLKGQKDVIGHRAIIIARCHEQDDTKLGLRTQTELRMVSCLLRCPSHLTIDGY